MKTENNSLWNLITIFAFVAISHGAQATQPVISTFETDLECWTVDRGQFGWSATQGDPGGCLLASNAPAPAYALAVAPAKFHGDWTSFNGRGTLSYSHKIFSIGGGMTFTFAPYLITISGPGGLATWTNGTPTSITEWTTVSAPITSSAWRLTSGSWSGLLSNVTNLLIQIEQVGNVPANAPADVSGIDNVMLIILATNAPLVSLDIEHAVQVSWSSETDHVYQVQWRSELNTNVWFNLASPV